MAALEFELLVSDPRNPMVGGIAAFTADGVVVRDYILSGAQLHFLLGRIAAEVEDLVNGEGGDSV